MLKSTKSVTDVSDKYSNAIETCTAAESGGTESTCDCEEPEVGVVTSVVIAKITWAMEATGVEAIHDPAGESA